jgi:hypothetical protein
MKKQLSALLAIAVAGLLASCASIIPTGVTVEKDFGNKDFDRVNVSSAFEFAITRGDSYSVLVQADQALAENIAVDQSGATLNVYLKPLTLLGGWTSPKVIITMPYIAGLDASGASKGTVGGFTAAAAGLTLNLSGASKLDLDGGDLDHLSANVSGASDVRVKNLAAAAANLDISGASKFAGEAGTVTVGTLALQLSGASKVSLDVSGKITGSVSGASTLRYGLAPDLGGLTVTGASDTGPR